MTSQILFLLFPLLARYCSFTEHQFLVKANCAILCYNLHSSLIQSIVYSLSCLGQENPCEGISLGSCYVEEESILNTFSAPPDKCSNLCEINNNCRFWRARWDGSLCYLLTSDYQHVSTSNIFTSA